MTQIARCDWLPEPGLPAVSRKKNFSQSHIMIPLLTKFVRFRWLDIALVLFFASLWTSTLSQSINMQKKNLANNPNIHPSWPHTSSIAYTSPYADALWACHATFIPPNPGTTLNGSKKVNVWNVVYFHIHTDTFELLLTFVITMETSNIEKVHWTKVQVCHPPCT